jgi:hypothetical protein
MDYTVGHVNIGVLILIYGVPLIAAGLAFWSWRAGRADLVGGAKLAGVLFVLWVVRWIFSAHHVIDEREQLLLNTGLGLSLYESVLVAVLYLGLEPTVRKRWPWRLVSWNRLLAGRFLDPLLARDLLIGLAAGAGIALLACHINVGPFWAPELIVPQISGDYELNPSRCIIIPLTTGLRGGFIWFFLVFVIHWVCRNPWIGSVVVIIVVQGIFLGAPASKPLLQGVSVFIGVVGLQLIALRFGLVAFAASMLCYGWLLMTGWTLDVGAWFATGPNLGIVLLLTLTAACAYLASRGRESEP